MKKYKIQNRSQKNSHSCVPLRKVDLPVKVVEIGWELELIKKKAKKLFFSISQFRYGWFCIVKYVSGRREYDVRIIIAGDGHCAFSSICHSIIK